MFGFWLATLPSALAHRPHTVVPAMAIPADFGTSGRALLVCSPGPISLLMSTEDFGGHWTFIGGEPTADDLVAGAVDGGRSFLIGQTGNVWQTDNGRDWRSAAIPDAAAVVDTDVVAGRLVVGGDALWAGSGSDPGAVVRRVDAPMLDVDLDDDGADAVAAVGTDGTVWAGPVDTPAALPALPDGDRAAYVTWSAGELYVAGVSTVYAWRGGEWSACGALPVTDVSLFGGEVARLAGDPDGRVIAATGTQVLFVSDDGCGTWRLDDAGATLAPVYGGIGYLGTVSEAFPVVWSDGVGLVAAGWNGIGIRPDPDGAWSFPKLVSSDSVRGFAIAPDFPDDPRMAVGQYGGAVVWTSDGGASWTGSARGTDHPYGYDVAIVDTDVMLYATLEAFRSADAGQTWTQVDVPMARTRAFQTASGLVFALGEDTADEGVFGRLAVSVDRGQTWSGLSAYAAAVGTSTSGSLTVASIHGRTRWLVAVDASPGLLASDDQGATWTFLRTPRTDAALKTSAGVAAWPARGATRIVYADEVDGVQLSDDDGVTWLPPDLPPDQPPIVMGGADDGTLFVASGDGQVYRSDDGGVRWLNLGVRFPTSVHDLEVAPRFAQFGIVVAGTSRGEYWSADRGETWTLLSRYERFEDQTFHFPCQTATGATCATYVDTDAGNGGGWALQTLDVARFSFEGHGFHVLGARAGDGVVNVVVDGVALPDWTPDGSPLRVDGLPAGWHDVELRAGIVSSDALHIDVVEVYGDGMPLPIPGAVEPDTADTGVDSAGDTAADSDPPVDSGDPPPADTGDGQRCGCAAGAGGGAFSAGLAVLAVALRRRRPVRRAGGRG